MDDSWGQVQFGPLTYSPPSLRQLAQNALGEDNEILLPLLVKEWGMPKDSHLAKLLCVLLYRRTVWAFDQGRSRYSQRSGRSELRGRYFIFCLVF